MAKKQSFGDKVKKGSVAESLKYIKVISVKRSKNTNSLKFNGQMLAVREDKDLNSAVKEFLK
tara:strand:+ start:277 stop:462 length:186 start_codon:yes stop_codon:yes gene_type:complete